MLLWMGEGEVEVEGILGGEEGREICELFWLFLLDEVLTDGARGCDLVGGCVGLVGKGMGIAYNHRRPIEKNMSK